MLLLAPTGPLSDVDLGLIFPFRGHHLNRVGSDADERPSYRDDGSHRAGNVRPVRPSLV
jgi:hypothetical protein